jgi:hypothetical protein
MYTAKWLPLDLAHDSGTAAHRSIYMERREYGVGGKPQRLVAQDPQEPQGFYPVTKARATRR